MEKQFNAQSKSASSQNLERKLIHQDLLKESDSAEENLINKREEIDSDFSIEEENEIDNLIKEQSSKENWSDLLTLKREKYNCGPKGVRADYKEAQNIMKRRQEIKFLKDLELYRKQTQGSTFLDQSLSFTSNYDKNCKEKKDFNEIDSDEEFLASYKKESNGTNQQF